MFPDLEMFNKMHENGEKQYVWKKHFPMGSVSSTALGGSVVDRSWRGSDPALPPVSHMAAAAHVLSCPYMDQRVHSFHRTVRMMA